MKKRILSFLLATALIGGTTLINSNKAYAYSLGELYTNAYNATMSAKSTGLQKDINTARTAIEALRGTGAEWAIGEFSRQVDVPQNNILVKFMTAYNQAKTDLDNLHKNPDLADVSLVEQGKGISVQKSIEKARIALDKDMPSIWRSSYSSALDILQQNYGQFALDLHKISLDADSGKLSSGEYTGSENIWAHYIMLDFIRNSSNPELQRWAKIMDNEILGGHLWDV